MEVYVAEHAGFCFGVTKAVETVYDQIKNSTGVNIYTYGPIIHNEIVVSDLEKKGVKVINSPEELDEVDSGIIVIRSHGVTKEAHKKIEETGLDVTDAKGELMFTYRRDNPDEGDNYFVDVYRFEMDVNEADVKIQRSEASEFAFAAKEEIKKLADKGMFLHFDSIKAVFE